MPATGETSGLAPLFEQYPGQTAPQPAHIELTEDGQVSADWSGEIGNAVPMRVWHGRTRRYRVPANISGTALHALLGRIAPLLARVHAGHWIEWDGNNRVGRLSDDAREAEAQIEHEAERLDDSDLTPVWPVSEWLFGSADLLQHWPAGAVDDAAQALQAHAEAERVLLVGEVRQALLDGAVQWLARGRPGLTAQHIDALMHDGRIDDAAATSYATQAGAT